MLITVITVIVLCVVLFKYYQLVYSYSSNPGIVEFPGALPFLGHVHLVLGDTVHLFNFLEKASRSSIENGGHLSFHLGPFRYIEITDPDDANTLLYTNHEKHYVYDFFKPWFGNGLVTSDYKKWQHHRKLLSPMFRQQCLNSFMGIFNKQARNLVERFVKNIGKEDFNHEPDVLVTSLETICQTAVGADVGKQWTTNKAYLQAVAGMMHVVINRCIHVWYHLRLIFDWSFLKKKQTEYLKVLDRLSMEFLSMRRSQFDPNLKCAVEHTDESKPFIDHLLKTELENSNFSDKDVVDHVNTLIFAGYDTNATAIVYCLMLLGHYKDVQEKAYLEILEVLESSDRDVDKSDLPKLVYLEAVIKESLRIYPIIPVILRIATTDTKLRKYELKAGTNYIVSLLGISRHPEWGPDVEEFRPERWLDGTLPTNPNLWAPFGLGKRSCIGKTYAMMSMKILLVHILRRFQLSSDISKLVVKMEVVMKPASGQHIRVEERKKSEVAK